MKSISGTKTPEDVNRIKENREKDVSSKRQEKNDKNDKYGKSQKFYLFFSSVVEFIHLRKEDVPHGVTNTANVDEEIILQASARTLESA